MKKQHLTLAAVTMVILGLALLFAGSLRPVTILVDGEAQTLHTRALTVAQALNQAGLSLGAGDQVSPPPGEFLGWNGPIVIERASQLQVWYGEGPISDPILTHHHTAGNMLAEVGIKLYPADRIFLNGEPLEAKTKLAPGQPYLLQVQPALPLTVEVDGQPRMIYSAAASIAAALWSAGMQINSVDDLSLAPEQPLKEVTRVALTRARPVIIQIGEHEITVSTAAERVGEVLAEAGIPLQNLDYSIPDEDALLPEDRSIRVVRVREAVILEQEAEPYDTVFIPDPETELDQRSILSPGQFGVRVSRLRVRYEDEVEVSRHQEAEWVASEPQNQVMGYGTKVVLRTLDTPGGPVEYWRAVTMHATSYSPCRLGVDWCNDITASGKILRHGIVAVTRAWFSWMRGQEVFVPGYGRAVVADTGGGIPGKRWIDLGYSDDDFISWSRNVTVYFLTPVPPTIPWILP
ncbi:MAG TPA: ubiquitin-like domain-containing protein [Levilinea sp.]|nr:ubiquitin-like domain-containing protein [Levilinea sp.]